MKPYLIISYFTACVVIGAAGDGMQIQTLSHTLKAVEVAMLFMAGTVLGITWKDILKYGIIYICFRIAGFDYIYNLTAGLPWDYVGNSSVWDGLLKQIPPHGVVFIKFWFLVAAVLLPFKYEK